MRIPPGGMGIGLKRAYSNLLFIILDYNLIEKTTWFLYRTNPRGYKKVQKLTQKKGKPLGVSGWPKKLLFRQHLLLFSNEPG